MSHSVFFSNLERIVDPTIPATADVAKKVRGSGPRSIWYPYDIVIVPELPPTTFLQYAHSLTSRIPLMLSPATIQPNSLDITDGFDDANITHHIPESLVYSYVPDPILARLTTQHNGHYIGTSSAHVIAQAGDKAHFAHHARGGIKVPTGQVYHGIEAATTAIQQRITQRLDTFVRLSHSGGGLGNRKVAVSKWRNAPRSHLQAYIQGNHPELWRDSYILVEDVVPLVASLGVAFDTKTSLISHTTQQITRQKSFYGCWVPCPPVRACSTTRLNQVATHFAYQLESIDYTGPAGVDLGLTVTGDLIGFEINARMTGGYHVVYIMEALHGPAHHRSRPVVAKAIDELYLRRPWSLEQLIGLLEQTRLLATPSSPYGVVISIPPNASTVGIVVLGQDYHATERTYARLLDLIGHPLLNTEDDPLLECVR